MSSEPAARAADLTLDEKATLLGGASTWRTHPVERVGIPALKMSDGPNGVRGDGLGARRTPGVVIPVGIALGATWDPDLVGELGDLLGREAVRKGAHVLLAPTVNLQRTPVGGRVFECMSEDPELTARLAVPYVRGVQQHGVAVTVKHFVVNDTEVDRMTVDVDIDGQTLRELYLRPFEAAVLEADAWGIMSAYNKLHGQHCAENRHLLTQILRDEWGFDGFVVSDWFGSHDTAAAVDAGLTVPMPGPKTIYGARLVEAVERGDVDEADLDRLVDDVLRLIDRVDARALSSERPEQSVDVPAERALTRRAAIAGMVLARNENGVLPIAPSATVALIGPNAGGTRIMGGGSASLQSFASESILDAMSTRVDGLVHEVGTRIDRMPPPMGERTLRTPAGEPGLAVDYRNGHDFSSPVVVSDVTPSSMLRFFGSTPAGVDPNAFNVTATGSFVPEMDGPHLFSAVLTGAGTVTIGDTRVFDDPGRDLPRGPLFFGMGSEEQTAVIECRAGEPVDVAVTITGMGGFAGIRVGVRPPDPDDLIERAAEAARSADVAVVVVGTNDEWETEGEDRSTIALPGEQDELVRQVAAANPNTVVVVNAGSPVSMPWIDDVAGVVIAYFGGQEMGPGVADVLLGEADPGGRLPITYPKRLEDTPAWPHYAPVDGVQSYGEGLLMGYRGFDRTGVEPLFAFGHGLSYGQATWGEASVSTAEISASELAGGAHIDIAVPISAPGDRAATVVVQGYAAPLDPRFEAAPKTLACFTKAVIEPGSSQDVTLTFAADAFRHWDADVGSWAIDTGTYELVIAASAADVRQTVQVKITR